MHKHLNNNNNNNNNDDDYYYYLILGGFGGGGAKLKACPGRHEDLLRPWTVAYAIGYIIIMSYGIVIIIKF